MKAPPGKFTLMLRSPPGLNLSEIALCGEFGRDLRRLMADASVLLTGATLDTVASGVQNGLWCFRSCKENKRGYLGYVNGNAPSSGILSNSSGVSAPVGSFLNIPTE